MEATPTLLGPEALLPGPQTRAYPQAMVVQVDPGLLCVFLLQELIGLHSALAGLLGLRPGESHLEVGWEEVTPSDLQHSVGPVPTLDSKPENATAERFPLPPSPSFPITSCDEIQFQPGEQLSWLLLPARGQWLDYNPGAPSMPHQTRATSPYELLSTSPQTASARPVFGLHHHLRSTFLLTLALTKIYLIRKANILIIF